MAPSGTVCKRVRVSACLGTHHGTMVHNELAINLGAKLRMMAAVVCCGASTTVWFAPSGMALTWIKIQTLTQAQLQMLAQI